MPGAILLRVNPMYIVQTRDKVTFLYQSDHQVPHIYMNVPHSKTVTPSWYGESAGRYEGDTLVVDTIGITTKAAVDYYLTPYTDQLHVVERYRRVDDGKTLEVTFTVEDPGAFTMPWTGSQLLSAGGRPVPGSGVRRGARSSRRSSSGSRVSSRFPKRRTWTSRSDG